MVAGGSNGGSFQVLAFALAVLAASLGGVAASSGGPVFNNTLVAVSATQTTVLGQHGVSVTYNNTLAQVVNATVFASFQNSAGNTVYYSFFTTSFQPKQEQTFFFGPTLPSGSYSARIFAINWSDVPLSVTSTVQVSL